jgi:rhodanese-related sulfurtransferase
MDAYLLHTHQTTTARPTPSTITIANLPRISRETLAARLLASPYPDPALAIIDVRDSDYIGGHIRDCTNVPSPTLDWKMPELVRTLRDKEVVVFHCALSQQRGPGAAVRYLRERESVRSAEEAKKAGKEEGEEDMKDEEGKKEQKVYVLEGGFVKWQEK